MLIRACRGQACETGIGGLEEIGWLNLTSPYSKTPTPFWGASNTGLLCVDTVQLVAHSSNSQTHKQTNKQTNRQLNKRTNTHAYAHTHKQTDKQKITQADKQTNHTKRQTDKQTKTQTQKKTDTHIHSLTQRFGYERFTFQPSPLRFDLFSMCFPGVVRASWLHSRQLRRRRCWGAVH